MLRLVLIVLVGISIFFVVLTIVLFKTLGWWALLALFVFNIFVVIIGKRFVGRLAKNLLLKPFALKGSVLEGAAVAIHAIEPAAPPVRDDLDEEDEEDEEEEDDASIALGPRRYVRVDLTITPKPTTGNAFRHWEPGEIMVAEPDVQVSLDEFDPVGETVDVRIWNGQEFAEDEIGKYEGAQRLALLLELPAELRRATLFYYFTRLVDVELPPGQ